MNIRLGLLGAALSAIWYGCAAEPQPQQPATTGAPASTAAPAPSESQSRTYRTGSRLPALEDDRGSASVGGVSKDDYSHDRNATITPMRGN